jgi:sulfonate transport system substrate-binding protein
VTRNHPLRALGLLAVVLAATLVAACSSEASTRSATDDGPTTTAAQVTVPETIPAGTVLKLGDQLDYLKTVLAVSGQDQDLPYTIEYAGFIGGPPMLQAFQGGAIDAGFVASTPLIFAQAAGQDIAAVAGWAMEHGSGGLISADPSIEGWDDIEGKRIAYQRGTSAEAAVLLALDQAGLTLADITTVDVPITQVAAAIKGGSADAGISTQPLTSLFIADTPGGREVAKADTITDRGSFLIASSEALADQATTAALADFTIRLVRAFSYLREHPELVADSVYAKQYGLSPEAATEIVAANGPTSFISLPDDIVEPQQKLADLFFAAGQIPAELQVDVEFDARFNDLIQQTQEDA